MNMDKYSKNLKDEGPETEDIDEKISEKTAEINRLSEELDDIYDMKRKADGEYEEMLSYWEGTPAFQRICESNDTRINLFRQLITKREDDLRNAKEEKKKMLSGV